MSVTTKSLQRQIADAAVACFERYGAQRTSMADIAQAAKISRQAVYRVFDTRNALIEFIITLRLTATGSRLKLDFQSYTTLAEALVEGSIVCLKAGLNDRIFVNIIEEETDHRLEQFLFRSSEPIQNMMLSLWAPILHKTRATGELRSDLSDSEIVTWIQQVQSILLTLDERDEVKQRDFFRKFLIPSLIAS